MAAHAPTPEMLAAALDKLATEDMQWLHWYPDSGVRTDLKKKNWNLIPMDALENADSQNTVAILVDAFGYEGA